MKTEDLIKAYMKDHRMATGDSKQDKKEVKPKPVKPVVKTGK